MRHQLSSILFVVAITTYLPSVNAAAILTADVERLVADASQRTSVPVIVRFEKEYEISELKEAHRKAHQYKSAPDSQKINRKQFRTGVFSSLKKQTQRASAAVARLLRKHGVKTELKMLWTINGIALDLPADLVDDITGLPGVERVTADMRLTMSSPEVEDSAAIPQWNIDKLNAPNLWQQEVFGEGVVVGIMDSGVDVNHPDLSGRWRGGSNSWFDPYQEHDLPVDLVGHGTQALGLILGGDESGYQVGLAPEAKWIAAKIFDDGNQTTLSAIHLAFQWLLDPDGDPLTDDAPHVVNNSWGFASTINQCYQEFGEDIRLLQEAGIGVVFAAGNYGPSTATSISPANNPGALSVGSIDQSEQIELLSSRGPNACDGGAYPKLVAPGALVFTTDLLPIAYNVVSGTSFAAPHVTGAIALLKSAFPELPVSQIETALYDSAVDLGETGNDDQSGYGLVDVSAAYELLFSNFGSDEQSQLIFSEPFYSVNESTQQLIVTVRRMGGTTGEVSVDFATSGTDARANVDYLRQSGRLIFADGETMRSFEIPIINDREDEENESFVISLSNVEGKASLGDQSEVEVLILDDDGAGSIAFSTVSVAVNEANREALISLVRTGGSAGTVDVEYQTISDTATAESDFIPTEGKVRFLSGETEKQISVELIDDSLFEGSELFQIVLTDIEGEATIGEPASTTITILDDDPDSRFASISLESVSYEIRENDGQITVNLIREGNLDTEVSVAYNTLDGSATKSEDYIPRNGRITFAEGISRLPLSIEIINDTLYETESNFTLILSDASNGAVISDPGTAIIRIIEDDALPFVSIQSPTPRSSSNQGSSDLGGQQSSDQAAGKSEAKGSSSLQIFDLNLRGYGESNRRGMKTEQEQDGDSNKGSDEENSEDSSCGSDSGHSNCDTETDETDQKSDVTSEESLSKSSTTEDLSESNTGGTKSSEENKTLDAATDSNPTSPIAE
ncbi:MAG: Calx-beta domain-containing protein [Candidatus Thiodiazotropha sp. 6PLUC9]